MWERFWCYFLITIFRCASPLAQLKVCNRWAYRIQSVCSSYRSIATSSTFLYSPARTNSNPFPRRHCHEQRTRFSYKYAKVTARQTKKNNNNNNKRNKNNINCLITLNLIDACPVNDEWMFEWMNERTMGMVPMVFECLSECDACKSHIIRCGIKWREIARDKTQQPHTHTNTLTKQPTRVLESVRALSAFYLFVLKMMTKNR